MTEPQLFLTVYTGMLFLQTIHIFEEIGMRAYEIVGSLRKYLIVASFLVLLNYLPLLLLLQGIAFGYYVAVLTALLALGNGVIHQVGYLRTRSSHATLGAGVYNGIPLGITGAWILSRLPLILI